MEKILDVPYYSQIDDVKREEWKLHSCGIVCLKMVFDFLNIENSDLDSIIDQGVCIGGHVDGKWSHPALVMLARNHGLSSYAQEFRAVEVDVHNNLFNISEYQEKLIEVGILKIKNSIDCNKPVIVSVAPGFGANNTGHLVLIVGYKTDNTDKVSHFIINDPDTRGERREKMEVDIGRFKNFWKTFAIFFE